MAVIRYFGLPGCGKTTTLASEAYRALGKYKNIYSNVFLAIDGVTVIPFDVFGVYELRDCLFLIDEAMIVCGDRDHKNFGKEKLKEFMMHRHKDCDIILFSQEADGVDKKIRSITDRMYYVKKGLLLGKWFSTIYRIPYDVMFPSDGDHVGDIIMGYKKPPILTRLFAKRLFRPRYYKYFDSWENDPLPPLPDKYQPYRDPDPPIFRPWLNKTFILLRSVKRIRKKNLKVYKRLKLRQGVAALPYFSFDLKTKKKNRRRNGAGRGKFQRMQQAA